jgi:hypothetical protein
MRAAIIQQQRRRLQLVPPDPIGNPWEFWDARTISRILGSPLVNVEIQWPLVVSALHGLGIADRPVQIAALATIGVEAGAFWPVREAYYLGEPEPAETWRRNNLWYWPWFGRGLIQLTHAGNYRTYGEMTSALLGRGVDLIARPDDALLNDVSAAVLALYFQHHRYQSGYGIPDAARLGDWENTRILVNGGLTGWDDYIMSIHALQAA